MSSIAPVSRPVNPIHSAASVERFIPSNNAPEPVGKARDPRGRFARRDTPEAMQTVFLPRTWAFGVRVGGMIFANPAAASRYARARAARIADYTAKAAAVASSSSH